MQPTKERSNLSLRVLIVHLIICMLHPSWPMLCNVPAPDLACVRLFPIKQEELLFLFSHLHCWSMPSAHFQLMDELFPEKSCALQDVDMYS
jgi:hypothetical protein